MQQLEFGFVEPPAKRRRAGKPKRRAAMIFPFPTARTSLVDRLADVLRAQSEDNARKTWDRTIARLRRTREASGLAPEVVTRDLYEFADAVNFAVWHRGNPPRWRSGGGR